jgi:hypothetical protein
MRLYEILDKPLPYQLESKIIQSSGCIALLYSFRVGYDVYGVQIIKTTNKVGKFAYVSFGMLGENGDFSDELTNAKSEFKVFPTVVKVILDNTKDIDNLIYGAHPDHAIAKREKLYNRLARYITSKQPVSFECNGDKFNVLPKNKIPTTE